MDAIRNIIGSSVIDHNRRSSHIYQEQDSIYFALSGKQQQWYRRVFEMVDYS